MAEQGDLGVVVRPHVHLSNVAQESANQAGRGELHTGITSTISCFNLHDIARNRPADEIDMHPDTSAVVTSMTKYTRPPPLPPPCQEEGIKLSTHLGNIGTQLRLGITVVLKP